MTSTRTWPPDASIEFLVGQVADEFTQRLNRGERPSVQEYVEKHPEIAEQLRAVLPALGLLRQCDVDPEPDDGDPNLSKPLGDFRLVREIGRGGMGIVYEAQQLSLMNRTVAVKVLPFAAALDPRHLQRFKNEAMAAASLHHEHIVPVYFVGCERGVHFYAMQYIEGLSLAAVIAVLRHRAGLDPNDPQRTASYSPPHSTGGPLAAVLTPPDTLPDTPPVGGPDTRPLAGLTTEGSLRSREFFLTVARLGLEAAKGLDHAHQKVVWHRDIKPANLLLDVRGRLWIADFGLAQMRDTQLTLTGELIGTLRYMSPEQALARRVPVDQRTDVYSLGATLYELLTLEPVFAGADRQELLRKIAFDDPRPPRRLNRHVPRDLETIVLTALAKAPAHRYASAKEMAEDLYRFMNDQPIMKRPEGWRRWLWRKSRRHATALALGLSALLASVLVLLVLLFANRPSPAEQEDKLQQRALAAVTNDLDRNERVVLIGDRGRPGYFRWRTDQTLGQTATASDGTFSVQNWEHGLLELLPDPRRARYRFGADVRHEKQTQPESKVGLYFAHSEHTDGATAAHFHYNVTFNDPFQYDTPGGDWVRLDNVVGLAAHRQPPAGMAHDVFLVPGAFARFVPDRPVVAPGPWRRIAVEVRPKSIKVFWEGKCIATASQELKIIGEMWLVSGSDKPPLNTAPRFAPRDGLGLFVSQGVASFRNVTLEPLDDEN